MLVSWVKVRSIVPHPPQLPLPEIFLGGNFRGKAFATANMLASKEHASASQSLSGQLTSAWHFALKILDQLRLNCRQL